MANVGTGKTKAQQASIFDALERIGLKAVLSELLLQLGYVLPDELRDPSMALGVERAHAMVGALELLGGFKDGCADLAHDRVNRDGPDGPA